jgi:DNA-binding CsgD family transcriptional regulator
MSEPEASDLSCVKWVEGSTPLDGDFEIVGRSAVRARAFDEAKGEIARQINGPLTALLLYMDEIKDQIQQPSRAVGNRLCLQQIVENAIQQSERIRSMIKQMADAHRESTDAPGRRAVSEERTGRTEEFCLPSVLLSSEAGQKPLTRRESEVLSLISEGYSNKLGALRMGISPRTFESHRAEIKRKLGARNTADLVRLVLRKPRDVLLNGQPQVASQCSP